METVPINKVQCPYYFQIRLPYQLYELEIRYNETHDFFTVDLRRNEATVVNGEKMVYGVPLFTDITDERIPPLTITPRSRNHEGQEVSYGTLEETVFLVVEP